MNDQYLSAPECVMTIDEARAILYVSGNDPTHLKQMPDGRFAWTFRFAFTSAIVVADSVWIHYGYSDRWCYETMADAVRALAEWTTEPEPEGWHRHPNSGRRRPHGVREEEYVNP